MASKEEERENDRIRRLLEEEFLEDNEGSYGTLFEEKSDDEEDEVEEDDVVDTEADDTDADPDFEVDSSDYDSPPERVHLTRNKDTVFQPRNNESTCIPFIAPPGDEHLAGEHSSAVIPNVEDPVAELSAKELRCDAQPHAEPPTVLLDAGQPPVTSDAEPPARAKKRRRTLLFEPSTSGQSASVLPPVTGRSTAGSAVPSAPVTSLPGDAVGSNNNIIVPPERVIRAKNGHIWQTRRQPVTARTPARNIVLSRRGVIGQAKDAASPQECFTQFFDDEIIKKIILHTNEEMDRIRLRYANQRSTTSPINKEEMMAFIGVLVNSAVSKDNHLAARELFDNKWTGPRYKCVMSSDRFEFILFCLRFDDKDSRLERKRLDPFAPIRELWEAFSLNCSSKYKPGSYVTVDEQLLGFRGKCGFRMYIPNKPSKYGIKIVMACDTNTSYMINGIPYVGKRTMTGGLPLSEYFVKETTRTIHGTHRNITTDNWFTSVVLADQLLKAPYNLTTVGTIRLNRKGVPSTVLSNKKERPINTSLFLFDKEKTIVSFKPKRNKVVTLLSTMHSNPEVNPISHKPAIIHTYNDTKGAVDTMDQMCQNMSCSRKTRRWPLCVFYGMLNIGFVNAYIIYSMNCMSKNIQPLNRKKFMKQLCEERTTPYMHTRLQVPTLRKELRVLISGVLGIPVATPLVQQPLGTRKTCFYCPSSKRRMTTNFCKHCNNGFCAEHRAMCCVFCDEGN